MIEWAPVVAALAGSASAFFSWRSSSKSNAAAEAANEAVALTVRPAFSLRIGGQGPHRDKYTAIRIRNTRSFDAVDVEVWVRSNLARDLARATFPRIQGMQDRVLSSGEETIFIDEIKPLNEGERFAFIATIRYSDDRGLRKWEQIIRYTISYDVGATMLNKNLTLGEPFPCK
ncbi:hypothetical protein [Amycolatopsis jejuensis]|uniref:hypothetical protein n=1 Tax=Amycolatopsis jejuensis TaxID=330084 RepID=UPI0012E0C011|nr:hypothetical protein [Amycolatopsis jejuensis]